MKHVASIILILLTFLGKNTQGQVREIMNINEGWHFSFSNDVRKGVDSVVNLPHTWNVDANVSDYFRGSASYVKDIIIPASWKNRNVYLRFKGVNTVANVFVNNTYVETHKGGYTAFVVDITSDIKFGEKNRITVFVSNALDLEIMPLLGDFTMYGGIYRDVSLESVSKSHISLTDYASSGIYISTPKVSEESAMVRARVVFDGERNDSLLLKLNVVGDGDILYKTSVNNVSSCQNEYFFDFEIKKPHLWNGRKDPYLYICNVDLYDGNKLIDHVSTNFGLRYFTIDSINGFSLNGKHLSLHGVCRHQDREGMGNAITKAEQEEDVELMLEMGVNAVRLAHYPQDSYIYDLCDKYGIIVWAELPFVGPGGYKDFGFVDSYGFKGNGRRQLKELIRQNFNHPSICFWGLFNELNYNLGDPCSYISELNALAKIEDPNRYTTAATNNDSDRMNKITDLICWNQYFGWYGGEPSSIGTWADNVHKKHPSFKIGISEYGAGASINHQTQKLKKPSPNSMWHPENWQTYFHEEYIKAIDSRPFLWGTFVWNMFDFGAAHRTEGDRNGINDKGLVTYDRKIRKDAFYLYKANWNKEDGFVYIAERRLDSLSDTKRSIKVFSNQKSVNLYINGRSLGRRDGQYGIFKWDDVELRNDIDYNIIEAKSQGVKADTVFIKVVSKL